MTELNPIAVVTAVHRWNEEHLVYQHGDIKQQITKYYRMLGTVAEGVQKMDSLLVSAGAGQAITTLIGILGFYARLHQLPDEDALDAMVLNQALNNIPPGFKANNDYNTLLFEHNKAITTVFEALLDNQQEQQRRDIVLYTKLAEALGLLIAIASGKGLVVTRSILNAVAKLEATDGVMNELGQFVKTIAGNK